MPRANYTGTILIKTVSSMFIFSYLATSRTSVNMKFKSLVKTKASILNFPQIYLYLCLGTQFYYFYIYIYFMTLH